MNNVFSFVFFSEKLLFENCFLRMSFESSVEVENIRKVFEG